MKEYYKLLTPLFQALFIVIIGALLFSILSLLIEYVISFINPVFKEMTGKEQLKEFPISYMLVNYLPFQVGFLLFPSIIYVFLTKSEKKGKKKVKTKNIIAVSSLFILCFFLLPFFTEINLFGLEVLQLKEKYLQQKLFSDEVMGQLVGTYPSKNFYVSLVIIGLITGIAEELAFRRFLFQHLLDTTKKVTLSVLVSAGIFAVLHMNVVQMLPLFLFGITFSLIYYYSGTIWLGALFHAVNNMINLYWLAQQKIPSWMNEINLTITLPSLLIVVGIVYYLKKKE